MHRALLAGASPGQVAEAAGTSVRPMYEQRKQWVDGQRHSLIAGQPGTPTIQHWLEHRDREPDFLSRPTVPITTASILPSGMHRIWIDSVDWGRVLSGAVGRSRLTDRAGGHWNRRPRDS